MPEHETPQGSFQIEDGAFVVPEAPHPDTRSPLRRRIDTEAEEGRLAHQASQGGTTPAETLPNAIRSDIGYNTERPPKSKPPIVSSGYAKQLHQVVKNDGGIRRQQALASTTETVESRHELGEMDAEARRDFHKGAEKAREALGPRPADTPPAQSTPEIHSVPPETQRLIDEARRNLG